MYWVSSTTEPPWATSGFYDPTTGILTLTSAGGLPRWQWQALRAITFVNTGESTPVASRSISFQVSDGVNSSVVAAKGIDVQDGNIPPVLTLPSTLNFSEDTSGFITGISVSDADAGSGSVTLTLSVPAGRFTRSPAAASPCRARAPACWSCRARWPT